MFDNTLVMVKNGEVLNINFQELFMTKLWMPGRISSKLRRLPQNAKENEGADMLAVQ